VAALRARTGVQIEVISGEEEGRLAYLAARPAWDSNQGSLVVFDTGGGSSQFTFGHDARVDERFSVDVGAVRYTERFRTRPRRFARGAARGHGGDFGRPLAHRRAPGSRRAGGDGRRGDQHHRGQASARHLRPDGRPGQRPRPRRDRSPDRALPVADADARRAIVGLQPKRAEVILAGACIVRTVMEKLGKQSFTVSDRGLRHGVLAERFGA
jgi:exopolyphosphatase/guanosine-5'-triphosphate,3'-diphosphate pyrophosphatase